MRVGDGSSGSVRGEGEIITDPIEKAGSSKKLKPPKPPRDPEEPPSAFARILRGLGGEVDRGEVLMRHAVSGASGKDLGNNELIALQAGVYRYSEAVDLSAKLVDRVSSGVKTVLQGQ
jgi:hypothetical protein